MLTMNHASSSYLIQVLAVMVSIGVLDIRQDADRPIINQYLALF